MSLSDLATIGSFISGIAVFLSSSSRSNSASPTATSDR
jgi:hypothetical protein